MQRMVRFMKSLVESLIYTIVATDNWKSTLDPGYEKLISYGDFAANGRYTWNSQTSMHLNIHFATLTNFLIRHSEN